MVVRDLGIRLGGSVAFFFSFLFSGFIYIVCLYVCMCFFVSCFLFLVLVSVALSEI